MCNLALAFPSGRQAGRQAGRQGSEPLAASGLLLCPGGWRMRPWALIALAPAPKTLEAARSVPGWVLCPWELGSIPGMRGQSSAKLSLTRDGQWAMPACPAPAAAGQGLRRQWSSTSEGWKGEPGKPAGCAQMSPQKTRGTELNRELPVAAGHMDRAGGGHPLGVRRGRPAGLGSQVQGHGAGARYPGLGPWLQGPACGPSEPSEMPAGKGGPRADTASRLRIGGGTPPAPL